MCSTLIGSGLTRKDLTMLEYLQSTHSLAYLALLLNYSLTSFFNIGHWSEKADGR